MSMDKRLSKLETNNEAATSEWVTPIEVRILAKAVARHYARKDGREPQAYTQEEIAHLRDEDLEAAVGRGVVGEYRGSGGWGSPEGQVMLDEWEESARCRVEAMAGLPPERWGEVYDHDELEEELHDE